MDLKTYVLMHVRKRGLVNLFRDEELADESNIFLHILQDRPHASACVELTRDQATELLNALREALEVA